MSMASITSLADELLLNVISSLDQQSLWSLSLVNKQIGAIAQEALYYQPYLPPPYGYDRQRTEPTNRLLHLVRTLLDRPTLANQIRGLAFSTGLRVVPDKSFGFEEMCHKGGKVVRRVTKRDRRWRVDWGRTLPNADHSSWAGVMLCLTTRLEVLGVEALHVPRRSRMSAKNDGRYASEVVAKLFRGDRRGYSVDLRLIPGLQNFQHISFDGKQFESSWLHLPSLHSVDLGVRCNITSSWPESVNAQISEVKVARECLDFCDYATPNLRETLEEPLFASVTILTLHFSNLPYHADHGTDPIVTEKNNCASFDYLGAQLSPVKDQLESLWLEASPCEDFGFLDFIYPFGQHPQHFNLSSFTKLKTLTLPQNALFRVGKWNIFAPALSLSTLLPRTLETLGILYLTLAFSGLACWFVKCAQACPNLFFIDLHCRIGRGDNYLTIISDESPGWCEFERAGFTITTYNEERNSLPE